MTRHPRRAAAAALAAVLAVGGLAACGGSSQSHECIKAMDDVARHQLEMEAAGQIPAPNAVPAQVQCVIQPDGSRSYLDRAAGDYAFYWWLNRSLSDPGYGGYGWMHQPQRIEVLHRVEVQAAPVRVKEAPPKKATVKPPAPAAKTNPVTFEPAVTKDGKPTAATTKGTTPVTYEPQVTKDGKPTVNPPAAPTTTAKPPPTTAKPRQQSTPTTASRTRTTTAKPATKR